MRQRALLVLAVAVLALGLTAAVPASGQPAGPVDSVQQSSAEFNITNIDAPASATIGENITVNVTVENEGGEFGTQDVFFSLGNNNTVTDTSVRDVGLDIGESKTVQATLNTSGFEPGPAGVGAGTENDTVTRTISLVGSDAAYFAVQNVSAPGSVVAGSEFTADVTIENTGSEFDEQDVTTVLDGVNGSDADTVGSVGLDVGESQTLQVTLDTAGFDPGTATLNASTDNETASRNVSVVSESTGTANFTITNLTVPGSVTVGDTFTADVTVENTGDAAGTQGVPVSLDGPSGTGERAPVANLSLDAGESQTVQAVLNTSGFETGTATLVATTDNDTAARSVSIVSANASTANFTITNLTAPGSVTVGNTFIANATIENTGDAFGAQDVDLGIFGPGPENDTATVPNVSLDISESQTVQVTLDTAGFGTGTATLTVDTDNDSARRNVSLTAATNGTGTPYWPTEGYDVRSTNHNPTTTAPTASQSVEWSFDVNSAGSRGASVGSSAAVVGDEIYFGDATSVSATSYVFKLDAATGNVEWRYAVGRFEGRSVYDTPTVANGTVYAGDTGGNLFAIDAETGTEEYVIEVGQGIAADRATEPTVDGGTLYFGDHNGALYAYDAATGQRQWRFEADNSTNFAVTGAPVLTEDTVYFTTDSNLGYGVVYALNRETGAERWNRTFTGNTCVGSFPQPALYQGQLFVGDTCDSEVNALDPATGATLWNVSVTGDVVAEPAIDGEHLFVTDTANTLTAVDLSTRSIDWQQGLGGAGQSSPTVANGMVYVGDDSGQLRAFDASSGAQMFSELFDGSVASAPTPAAGSVYVGASDRMHKVTGSVESGIVTAIEPSADNVDVGGRETLRLTAANTGDGVGAFNATIGLDRPGLAEVVNVTVAGNPANVNLVRGNGSITVAASGLNISDPTAEPVLAELTFAGRESGELTLSPTIGSIQSPSGRSYDVIERRDATLTVRADTGNWRQDGFNERNTGYSPDATAVAAFPQIDWTFDITVDHENGGRKGGRWIARSAVSVADGAAFIGDRAGFTSPGYFYSMNASTGEYRWRGRLTAFNRGMRTTPAVSGGRVFYGDDAGTIWARNATNGSEVWSVNLGSGTASDFAYSPTVVGNRLYVTNDAGKLFAYDTSDGSQVWVHESSRGYPGRHAAAVYDGRVYYATSTGAGEAQLYAVDAASGNEVWNRTFDQGSAGTRLTNPTVGDDTLYVSDPRRSQLTAISPDNGTTLWSVSVDADIRAPPAYAEGVVYATDESGSLYAIDEDNRSIVWEREIGNTFTSSPSVANGVVYAGSRGQVLYAVDAGSGQVLWSERVDGTIDAAPTPIDGRVYVGGGDLVYAFEGPAEPWTVQRTVSSPGSGVQPGDDITVTLNASVTELPPEGDLEIEETVAGPVENISVAQTTVDGTVVTPNGSTATANGINVSLDRATVEGAQVITVSYTASVLRNATRNSTVDLDGRLAFNGSEQRVGTQVVQVGVASVTLPGASGPAQSIDSDPLLEDVDGDGAANVFDAIALYNNRDEPAVQNNPQFFDFDGDGSVNVFDAIELYNEIS